MKTAQLFSDIHLEFYKGTRFPRIPSRSDYLFLAGDIGNIYKNPENFVAFFDYCSKNWKKVFYVAGNHEFYYGDGYLKDVYREFFGGGGEATAKYDNVYYLSDEVVDLDDEIQVYGTTLWTRPVPSPSLNDYNHIGSSFIANKSAEQHRKMREFIQNNNKPTIILTHFPPTQVGTSHPKFHSQPQTMKDYFAWDTQLLLGDISQEKLSSIRLWCSGHTHYSYNIPMMCHHAGFGPAAMIPCVSNQMGYPGEEDTDFECGGIIEF